jgi:hypothetical protein
MSRTEAIAPLARTTAKPPADVRTFWRVLLAVVAPIPMLAKGIYYVISPVAGDGDFDTTMRAFAADRGLAGTLRMLDIVFCVLLVPAVYAVVWAARRGAPRLTTVGGFLSLTGCLAGFGLMGGITTPPYLAAVNGLDADAMRALQATTENDPIYQVASLLFIVGIVIGLGLLGTALWRSRVRAGMVRHRPADRRRHAPVHPDQRGPGHRPARRGGWLRRRQRGTPAHPQRRLRPTAGLIPTT